MEAEGGQSRHPDMQIVDKFNAAKERDAQLFLRNFVSPDQRVRSYPGFEGCVGTVSAASSTLGNSFDTQVGAEIVATTMKLNPNADISQNGRFIVAPEHKKYLLESLCKAVIGRTPGLSPNDFGQVAELYSQGLFFEDGQGHDPGDILTPMVRLPGKQLGEWDDTYWAPYKAPQLDMGDFRPFIHGAESYLVRDNLRRHMAEAGPEENLEVCAGWGDFSAMASEEFNRNCIHTEWNQQSIDHFRERFPDADVRRANVYGLPFGDGKFANVVGLTPFVSLRYLDYAVAEIDRVMKPGGRFFSFQDLIPNDAEISEQMHQRGMVPDQDQIYWFRSVEDRTKVAQSLIPVKGFADEAWFEHKKTLHENAYVQNMYEYFDEWVTNELRYRGMNVLEHGYREMSYIAVPSRRHTFDGIHAPTYMFASGQAPGPHHEPHDIRAEISYEGDLNKRIYEHAGLWMVVAEKPEEAGIPATDLPPVIELK